MRNGESLVATGKKELEEGVACTAAVSKAEGMSFLIRVTLKFLAS